MRCKYCKTNMKIVDTRKSQVYNLTWRRHKCLTCGHLMYTHELPVNYNVLYKCEEMYEQIIKRKASQRIGTKPNR